MINKQQKRFEAMRQRSEEKILRAALELFANNGYKNTSISDIAKKAMVSKGLIYNYFTSKQDLLRAIATQAIATGNDIVQNALDDHATPILELEYLIVNTFEQVKENFQFWKLLMALSHQPHIMEPLKDLVEAQKEWGMEKGVELFTKLKSPNPLQSAFLLGAALDGILLHYIHSEADYPIDEVARNLIETFTHPNSIHRGI